MSLKLAIWKLWCGFLFAFYSSGRITFAMTRSLRVHACAQWWRASGDDVKPSLGTWREGHPTFQLTKHWDYRSRHQSVDNLTAIGSAALVVLATAGSTNSVRTISAHLLTHGEQPSGVAILERRYGPRRVCDDDDDDDFYSNCGRICSRLWDIQRQKWCDLENQVRSRSRSLKMAPFDRQYATFYWSTIVSIALSCAVFELFDVE